VTRAWPPTAGVLDTRWLELQVTARAHGGTLLWAESQSQWVVTRPAAERIPAGVREVDVSDAWPGKRPLLTRRVTGHAQVRALVGLFNSLGIAQPVTINCPAETLTPIVTVRFRRSAGATPVARAAVSASANFPWPADLPGANCYPITFSVEGRRGTPLVGNVIAPLQRRLGVRFARSR
jgi:hypothetical protein